MSESFRICTGPKFDHMEIEGRCVRISCQSIFRWSPMFCQQLPPRKSDIRTDRPTEWQRSRFSKIHTSRRWQACLQALSRIVCCLASARQQKYLINSNHLNEFGIVYCVLLSVVCFKIVFSRTPWPSFACLFYLASSVIIWLLFALSELL